MMRPCDGMEGGMVPLSRLELDHGQGVPYPAFPLCTLASNFLSPPIMFGAFRTASTSLVTFVTFGSYVTVACFFSKETSAFFTPLALTKAARMGSAHPPQCMPVTSSTAV